MSRVLLAKVYRQTISHRTFKCPAKWPEPQPVPMTEGSWGTRPFSGIWPSALTGLAGANFAKPIHAKGDSQRNRL